MGRGGAGRKEVIFRLGGMYSWQIKSQRSREWGIADYRARLHRMAFDGPFSTV